MEERIIIESVSIGRYDADNRSILLKVRVETISIQQSQRALTKSYAQRIGA
jgi:hypothetical protein